MMAQVSVINISGLSPDSPLIHYADVEGWVLVKDMGQGIVTNPDETGLSGITPFPGWPVQYSGASQRGGVFGNLDSDPDLEILYCVNQMVYAFNIDGTVVEGWPVTTQLYPDGAPALGDIDGDGVDEVVVSTRQAGTGNTGRLHAWELDGTSISGFPVVMTGGATKTPVLADLDQDGDMEIIIEERAWPDGYVGVYQGDGSLFPGFPVALDYIPASSVAVGDITGDDIPEIVAESYYSVYAFDVSGNVLEGFPYSPGTDRVFSYSSPVLADLDGDGYREILVGDHSSTFGNGAVHVIRNDGSAMDGWPQFVGYWIYGPPAVGDIDGDGSPDVAVGDQVLSGTPADQVYVWDKNGNDLPGWPSPLMWAINNQILLADIDGDDQVELMWDDNTNEGRYMGYNHDGTPMEGWPLAVNGSTFFMMPAFLDANNDGIMDITGASSDLVTDDLFFYLWDAGVGLNPSKAFLTILQYDKAHSGVYRDPAQLAVDFTAFPVALCAGDTVQFTDLSTGNIQSWIWTFPGGEPATSSLQNPEVKYETPGLFDVSLTISDGNQNLTITKEDFIGVSGYPGQASVPDGPATVDPQVTPWSIYETVSQYATSYTWQIVPASAGTLEPADTVNSIKVVWDTSGISVALIVRGENMCGEGEFSDPLVITLTPSTSVPGYQTEDPLLRTISGPNGEVSVELPGYTGSADLQVLSLDGRVVFSGNIQGRSPVRLSGLNSGVYLVKVRLTERTLRRKIIVR
ncbi:MAG: hypothetical protein Kow00127_16530 [Bacteroidales bacterium]